MKTPSSMVTPSQTKEWLDTLQWDPMTAPRCTSTNAPMRVGAPVRAGGAAVEIDQGGWRDRDVLTKLDVRGDHLQSSPAAAVAGAPRRRGWREPDGTAATPRSCCQ